MNKYCLIQMTNTFILTLDGDVDFQPEAVLLLLDRMKKNENVGAACGRIHPLGSGWSIRYYFTSTIVISWFNWYVYNNLIRYKKSS